MQDKCSLVSMCLLSVQESQHTVYQYQIDHTGWAADWVTREGVGHLF